MVDFILSSIFDDIVLSYHVHGLFMVACSYKKNDNLLFLPTKSNKNVLIIIKQLCT